MKSLSFSIRMSLVALLVLLMFILHNSFWLWRWDAAFPIILGFMPFAFFYYVLYAVLATLVMILVGKIVWPDIPDEELDK